MDTGFKPARGQGKGEGDFSNIKTYSEIKSNTYEELKKEVSRISCSIYIFSKYYWVSQNLPQI